MAERLNHDAFEFAKGLVHDGKVVRDERDDWSEHQPSSEKENNFIQRRGFAVPTSRRRPWESMKAIRILRFAR